MIENILILDTETTGLSTAKGEKMIEICGILYNLQHKAILQVFSTLLPTDKNGAQHINLIDPVVTQLPYSLVHAEAQLLSMAEHAQAIVAHNASFDKEFVNWWNPELAARKWVCTRRDFKWPVPLARLRLQDVCEAMGVQYVEAHRALNDCMFMVHCFNKVEDLVARFNS